jgi:hypothetical protein
MPHPIIQELVKFHSESVYQVCLKQNLEISDRINEKIRIKIQKGSQAAFRFFKKDSEPSVNSV